METLTKLQWLGWACAWANEEELEYRFFDGTTWGEWRRGDFSRTSPLYDSRYQYRVKPKKPQYRLYKSNKSSDIIRAVNKDELGHIYDPWSGCGSEGQIEESMNFGRWITDWIEYDE